jgi:ribosomal protein S18 acetylase RimI-like enzyme
VISGLTRRPETDADTPFLLALYGSTREHELALVDWSAEAKQAFVAMQFDAQRGHYRREYPSARFEIVERHGTPVGRLYIDERPGDIRVMDITITPQARSQGIGGALLADVLARGRESGRTVSIHVELHNPARRLYDRLGFRPVGEPSGDGVYVLLEARPFERG